MNFKEAITKCTLQVREECQFFGALMLFAEVKVTKKYSTAATDGKFIFMNESFFLGLSSKQQNALLLHEVLHMALLHVTRRGTRDVTFWNIAADIVVNNLILENTKFKLPEGAIVEREYFNNSVEEIYEKILKDPKWEKISLPIEDILASEETDLFSEDEVSEIEGYWRDKMQVLSNSDLNGSMPGNIPGGMQKEIEILLEPEVDWRHALWKFVAKTPVDFDDLDRRFMHRGLYIETLLADALEVNVCIDTSGSISSDLLDKFLAELKGIMSSYPHVICNLFYADTDLYGPYEIDSITKVPSAEGFGGTCFRPFFNFLDKANSNLVSNNNRVAVYFTDGFGDFPEESPCPTMWLVPRDCLESSAFPFGEVIRISSE